MSVVGFDFGTSNCVVAVAQKGGIDVVLNEASNRWTPTMVSFGDKERHIGEAAQTQWLRNLRNTVTNMKRLIGRQFRDKDVQDELKHLGYKVKETAGGKIGIEVMYAGENVTFTPETIVAMMLNQLKRIAEKSLNAKVRDVVIAIPGFWTDQQRRAMLDAASIAGLNCLRLIHELTSSALGYGIYKTDLPEKDSLKVLFIDIGDSSTSASVVSFLKGQLKVNSAAYNHHLGGRNFDEVLVNHLAKEFQGKYKINVFENQKALLRVRQACERLKKMLSSNSEAPVNIDSLMNDIDVRAMVDRKTFEELSKDLLDQVCDPVKQALEEAGVSADQLFAVEIIGGASRSTSICKRLSDFLKRDLSRTLNSEESVARGCALQCAILSPIFKVKEFVVNDISLYPIRLSWKYRGSGIAEEDSAEVFTKNNPIPSPKMITFKRADGIDLTAGYVSPPAPRDLPTVIGNYTVSSIPSASDDLSSAKVKVKVKLDIHGIFNVESAQLVETLPETADSAAPASPAQNQATVSATSPSDSKPMEADPTTPTAEGGAAAAAEDGKKKEEEPKKRKVKRTDLQVGSQTASMNMKELQSAVDEEIRMLTADQMAAETADRKNAVESYVYSMRSRIGDGDLSDYTTDQERTPFLKVLDDTEQWLYGDGEDVTKNIYQNKLDELRKTGEPIVVRKKEYEERPDAVKSLMDSIAMWKKEASSTDEKYDHIDKADLEKVLQEVKSAEDWIYAQLAKQDVLPKTANPALFTVDVNSRKLNLNKFATNIMSKPKPKPKPVETPKPADTKPTEQPQQPDTTNEQPQPQPQSPPQTPNASHPPPQKPPQESTSSMEVD